jgi:Tol biopolymer transport system component
LSPSGAEIAFDRYDQQHDLRDVWLMKTDGGAPSRLTFDASDDSDPVWSPDEGKVYFFSDRAGVNGRAFRDGGLYVKSTTGREPETLVVRTVVPGYPRSVSPDGRFLLYQTIGQAWDLWAVATSGADGKPFPVVASPANDTDGQFCPTAPVIAYVSDESGRPEVYVQAFPAGGRWQVSTGGGTAPRWRRDGRELYFVAPDRMLMAVSVDTAGGFRAGVAVPLFRTAAGTAVSGLNTNYAPAPDGQRFLVTEPDMPPLTISVVTNWTSLLKK